MVYIFYFVFYIDIFLNYSNNEFIFLEKVVFFKIDVFWFMNVFLRFEGFVFNFEVIGIILFDIFGMFYCV